MRKSGIGAATEKGLHPLKTIVASAPLGSSPDYVRYVALTNEVWVTQPGKDQIEIFSLTSSAKPALTHSAYISVPGKPESLVIDGGRSRAYTH